MMVIRSIGTVYVAIGSFINLISRKLMSSPYQKISLRVASPDAYDQLEQELLSRREAAVVGCADRETFPARVWVEGSCASNTTDSAFLIAQVFYID